MNGKQQETDNSVKSKRSTDNKIEGKQRLCEKKGKNGKIRKIKTMVEEVVQVSFVHMILVFPNV